MCSQQQEKKADANLTFDTQAIEEKILLFLHIFCSKPIRLVCNLWFGQAIKQLYLPIAFSRYFLIACKMLSSTSIMVVAVFYTGKSTRNDYVKTDLYLFFMCTCVYSCSYLAIFVVVFFRWCSVSALQQTVCIELSLLLAHLCMIHSNARTAIKQHFIVKNLNETSFAINLFSTHATSNRI